MTPQEVFDAWARRAPDAGVLHNPDASYAVVHLREPDCYADGEREWGFSGAHFDGFVNLGAGDGGVEIHTAFDTGSTDGLTTVAEGFVPLSALRPLAAALLSAADAADRSES